MSGPHKPAVREGPCSPIGLFGGAGLVAAIVILVLLRLHAFDLPMETDECNYAVIAARLLAGDRLYVDVWDHQPFGVFTLFAAVITVFGDAPHVFRWMALLFSVASLLLVFAILRRVAGRGAALLGALLFALASSDPGTGGEGCNREIYMNTLILAAWYFSLRHASLPLSSGFRPLPIILSGLCLALASTLKTIAVVHWVLLAIWIAWGTWFGMNTDRRIKAVATQLSLFALAPLLVWFAAFGYFAATDRLSEFADAVFLFNVGYSGSGEPFWMRFIRFFGPMRHPFIFDSALPLWIGAGISSIWMIYECVVHRDLNILAIGLLLLAGYVAICLPGRFWPHYYHLLLPASVLAVSITVQGCATWLRHDLHLGAYGAPMGRVFIYTLVPFTLAVTVGRDYLFQPPFGITIKRYNSRDFWGQAQGRNVASVTDPDDTIFVFGNDASIYYYSHRRCASRYTMITGLAGGMEGSEKRRRILMAELIANPPRLILVLFDEKPFDEWLRFLDHSYGEVVGVDYHDRTGDPIMFVFARKDQPIRTIDWNWDRSAVGGWQLGERRSSTLIRRPADDRWSERP